MSSDSNAGDGARAFDLLRPVTMEVPRVHVPPVVAGLWANLPSEERDATLLLASGRAMRTAANAAVQAERLTMGEISRDGAALRVLDRVTITREGARQIHAYRPGMWSNSRQSVEPEDGERRSRPRAVGGMGSGSAGHGGRQPPIVRARPAAVQSAR